MYSLYHGPKPSKLTWIGNYHDMNMVLGEVHRQSIEAVKEELSLRDDAKINMVITLDTSVNGWTDITVVAGTEEYEFVMMED